jgi:pilus assembly protein CpaE
MSALNISQNIKKPILLLDTDEASAKHIRAILESLGEVDIIHEGKEFTKFLSLIQNYESDIVILNLYPSIEDSIKLAKQITGMFPDVNLIAVADTMDPSIILNVMRARAREFLKQPVNNDELLAVINGVLQEKESAMAQKRMENKVITLFGPKGGVGTTTIASNMAISLAKLTKKDVLIVDLDLQFGNVALHLNVKSKYSILDVVTRIDQVEIPMLKALMPKGTNGISVLPIPQNIEEAESIRPVQIEKLLFILRRVFDYIIVDTHHGLDDISLKAMDESNFVLLVTTLDVPSLFHTKRSLQLFQKMGFTMEKLFLVINRFNALTEFDMKSTEKMLDYPIFWCIPEHDYKSLIASINKGTPISSMSPNTSLSKNYLDMSMKFNGTLKEEGGKKSDKSKKRKRLFKFSKS